MTRNKKEKCNPKREVQLRLLLKRIIANYTKSLFLPLSRSLYHPGLTITDRPRSG